MNPEINPITRVTRTKTQAKESYDRLSPFYDYLTGAFEQRFKDLALKRLNITHAETILEIGFGTGRILKRIAEMVGDSGKVYGIDISSGMLGVSQRRLEKVGLGNRVELTCDDALKLPYAEKKFDAVFMSFVLELFDTPEIPQVLAEAMRVLKPGGRIGVISMSKGNSISHLLRFYEWLHLKLPNIFDCRPIFVEQSVSEAGFKIQYKERVDIFGLPGEIVIGNKSAATS